MTENRVTITFDKAMGMYRAERSLNAGFCCGFGATAEEARAKLELAESLWGDCTLCQEEALAGKSSRRSSCADGSRSDAK